MKKVKIYIAFLFVLLILIFSCKKQNDQFSSFPVEKELDSKVPRTESKGANISQIEIIDSLLITYDHKATEQCIHIFKLKDFSYIASAGLVGKGPKEINRPFKIAVNKSKKIIWVLDVGKLKIIGYKIKNILSDNSSSPSYEVSFPKKLRITMRFKCYTDSSFAFGQGSEGLLKILDFNENVIDTIGNMPVKRKENEPEAGFSYKMRREFSIQNDTIVISFRNYDRIMAINKKGSTLFSIQGPDKIKPKGIYKGGMWQTMGDSKIGYGNVHLYKKHIFSLYSGKKNVIKKNMRYRHQFFTNIHIFDFQGNPYLKYKLDREIKDFVIDRKNNRFIGIGVNTEEGPFVVFNFNTDILKTDL